MKQASPEQLALTYAQLFPEEMGSKPEHRENLEDSVRNWLDRYNVSPEQAIATQNWAGKVTKAFFKCLDIKMPKSKTAMLQALA